MKRCFLLLFSLLCLTIGFASELERECFPAVVVVDKNDSSYDKVIADLLSLQKSLIVDPLAIPESFKQSGFLLVPMTKEYVISLLEKKEGQIISLYLDHTLLGYIILTVATEFEELYENILFGRFETGLDLSDVHNWLSDPAVGYIEQIGVRPEYARIGIGSRLIEMAKTVKPRGLISDVFIYPVENNPSLGFFTHQGFTSPGVLYQYPGANVNFPYEHKTQVFFWSNQEW